ncbi:type 1 glutamine amidotransferase domain-containing protein [Deinococcus peraridilitoris]|uniref:Intracellular protease, PfpI family n=1 Tax=Deinococcus peraridilitoris (strain DSM 19664 / LMG 22246 / CIP 109416 / KR-200) TaxID=937777 RepID=L0A0S9_DEIPD|nr:type 1 glutamine amidotransferase domain-containing protein [Deinococcus peraridilitoris]AFZ66782.1 intracellular protease, PfpI family [Deinococcus peraridilitoris DSM 19664]
MKNKALEGRHLAVLAADGFELVELVVPVKALKAAGATVDVISLRKGRILGMNLHQPAGRVRVTRTLDEAQAREYDGLLIPGGFINPDLLRQSERARAFVRAFDQAGKPIATLCHGPWLLASSGLLEGRTLTSWPGIRDDLVHAGATWLDQEVVRDGNWVSSRGPQDLTAFVAAALDHFRHMDRRSVDEKHQDVSDAPRNAPPAVTLTAMKWWPRGSLQVMLILGALGTGWWVMKRTSSPTDL